MSAPGPGWPAERRRQPEFTCRFRWRPGSLAFWDDRASIHCLVNDYPAPPGDAPVPLLASGRAEGQNCR